MADKTAIEWTDATWPIVQGCDYESPGCKHCYAVPLLWRLAHNPNPTISGPLQGLVEKRAGGQLVFTGKVALRRDRLDWPLKWKAPRKIFIPSHGDLFHPEVPFSFIDDVFGIMALCPQHTFQLLTKRPDRMRRYLTDPEMRNALAARLTIRDEPGKTALTWPLPNLWLGVSVEDRPRKSRIDELRDTTAALRFLSVEPLLQDLGTVDLTGIDWVICGGESGANARPMHPDWARGLRDQCAAAGVPFFFKQWGEWAPGDAFGLIEDGPVTTRSGDVHNWMKRYVVCSDRADRVDGHSFTEHATNLVYRVGKKRAGRLLDGVEHNAFPSQGATR